MQRQPSSRTSHGQHCLLVQVPRGHGQSQPPQGSGRTVFQHARSRSLRARHGRGTMLLMTWFPGSKEEGELAVLNSGIVHISLQVAPLSTASSGESSTAKTGSAFCRLSIDTSEPCEEISVKGTQQV